jgi:hypothetical protein
MKRYLALALCAGVLVFAACDLISSAKPTVTFVYPANGATIGVGIITIKVVATDDNGVADVEFFDGTTSIGTDDSATADTFTMAWTSTAGAHTLKAVATNDDGKTGEKSITVTVSGGGGPTYHSGTISASETWYPAGNPHIITGDVSVQDDDNSPILTIMPGCLVEFQGNYELYTGYTEAGAIVAEGKADSTILFTTTASPKTPGSWASVGIYYRATSATSFKYCTFEYGGSSAGYGTFFVNDAAVKFANNTVRYSGSDGAKCSGTGHFSEFVANTFSNNEGHALEVDPDYVGLLGGSNTFIANANNDILVRGGDVTSTATWLNQGVPYVLGGDISVQDASNSPVLTIAPGCSLKFNGDYEFYTGYTQPGAIVAEGTAAAPIVFSTTANPKTPGSWSSVGVYYRSTSATSFDYCTFEYGGSSAGYGAFFVKDASAKVQHCTITQSASDGVMTNGDGRFAAFTGNTISSCGSHAVEMGNPEYVRTLGSGNIYSGNTNNDILVHNGTMTTTGTWLNQGVSYTLAGDVKVEDASNSPVLTIAPGTTVKLQADVELYCGYNQPGGIIADGTSGEITFTSSVPSPSRGDWASISFYYRAVSSSLLKNCRIEYGGSSYGNIYIQNSTPTITGCNIAHSGAWGIYLNGTTFPDPGTLESANTFSDNLSGNVRIPPK